MTANTKQIDNQQKTGLTRIKKPRNGWHRADIKAALEKRGWTLASLSLAHDYNRGVVTQALSNFYPAVERLIADALETEPWIIWPDRYNDYGQPVQEGNPNMIKRTWGGRKRNVELKVVK